MAAREPTISGSHGTTRQDTRHPAHRFRFPGNIARIGHVVALRRHSRFDRRYRLFRRCAHLRPHTGRYRRLYLLRPAGAFAARFDRRNRTAAIPVMGAHPDGRHLRAGPDPWSQEYGTDIWRTPDGVHWSFVSKVGLGDGNNTGGRSFASTPFGLYMGTARWIGGTQVFLLDNSNLDFNNDGVIDQQDVNLM